MNECVNIRTLTKKSRENLKTLSKWAKFLGVSNIILGVIYSLMLLGASGISLLTGMIGATIYLILGYNLMGSANGIKTAVENRDPERLEMGLKKMDIFFKITGIIVIISFVIAIISFMG